MPRTCTPSRTSVVMVPKAEALDRIARHMESLKQELAAASERMKSAVKPGRYALNFQINALKKELHYWKSQSNRLKALPRSEVPLSEKLGT